MGTEQHRCSAAEEAVSSLKRIRPTPRFQRHGANDSLKGKPRLWPQWVSANSMFMKAEPALHLPPRLAVVCFLECSDNECVYVPRFGSRRVHSSPVVNVSGRKECILFKEEC